MIRAMIFDLDGTLVKTEQLKSISYARATTELRHDLSEEEVVGAFKEVVGLSRREVATALLKRFELEEAARERMADYGVDAPWQAFVQVRLSIYEEMLADPEVLLRNQWPHSVTLLREARRTCCKVGLATMSYWPQDPQIVHPRGEPRNTGAGDPAQDHQGGNRRHGDHDPESKPAFTGPRLSQQQAPGFPGDGLESSADTLSVLIGVSADFRLPASALRRETAMV